MMIKPTCHSFIHFCDVECITRIVDERVVGVRQIIQTIVDVLVDVNHIGFVPWSRSPYSCFGVLQLYD